VARTRASRARESAGWSEGIHTRVDAKEPSFLAPLEFGFPQVEHPAVKLQLHRRTN